MLLLFSSSFSYHYHYHLLSYYHFFHYYWYHFIPLYFCTCGIYVQTVSYYSRIYIIFLRLSLSSSFLLSFFSLSLLSFYAIISLYMWNIVQTVSYYSRIYDIAVKTANCVFFLLIFVMCIHMNICIICYGIDYSDVIMSAAASQITGLSIVYLIVCLGADQRKHQSSASLLFVRGIHRGPGTYPHQRPVRRKCFHLMTSSWISHISC